MGRPDSRRVAAVNGVLLFVTLVAFRVETALVLRLDAGVADWLLWLLPDAGFVAALEFAFLLTAQPARRSRTATAAWHASYVGVHLLLYAVAVGAHQFFLQTGAGLDLSLVWYTLSHARFLGGLVGSGVDAAFAPRAGLALLCLALGAAQLLKRDDRAGALSAAIPAVGLALSIGIITATPAPGDGVAPRSGTFRDFFGAGTAPGKRDVDAWLTANVRSIYEPPRVLGSGLARRPNIVLVLLESTRADVVAPYAPRERWNLAPFMAEFSRNAIVVESAYTTVPHTSKALIGILCGMYPALRMPVIESVPGQLPAECLPKILDEEGYRTAFLQTALGEFENRPGLLENLGFKEWMTQEDLGDSFEKTGYFGMDEFAMLEPAIDWVERQGDAPFFLTLLTVSTHHPYQTPGHAARDGAPPVPQYLDAIAHVDRFVGELHARLSAAGKLDNTLFILLGDHGEAFGEHLRRQHDVVPYEEAVRVPFLIQGPDWLGPPGVIGGLRHQLDLMPTLLDLLGVEWAGLLPGENIFTSEGHLVVMSSCWYDDYCMALRTGQLKFVYHYGRRPMEVFHLATDPGERVDLAAEVPATLLESVERQLLTLRYSVDAWYMKNAPGRPPEG